MQCDGEIYTSIEDHMSYEEFQKQCRFLGLSDDEIAKRWKLYNYQKIGRFVERSKMQ